MSRRLSMAFLLPLLPLLAVAAYYLALDNPFIYDDINAIASNELIRRVRFAVSFLLGTPTTDGFAAHQFRPLVLLSFSLNYLWGQGDPFTFRLVNLGLHACNVVLAALVLRRVARAFPLSPTAGRLDEVSASWAGVIGAALMAVHPIHSTAVLLVWKRATLLAGAFSLVAVLCFLRLRAIGGEPVVERRRRVWLTVGVLLAQLGALTSKEIAVATPLLLALLELWPRPEQRPWDRKHIATAARLHTCVILVTVLFAFCLYPKGFAPEATLSRWAYVAVQCKVVWLYVGMVFNPGLLSAAYSVVAPTGGDAMALLGAVCIVLTAVVALRLARRAPLPTLAFFWAAIGLLPSSSVIPIPLVVDEDRVYLPLLLAWGAAGGIAVHLARGSRFRRAVVLGCVGLAACAATGATVARASLWSSPVEVWLDAVRKHPRSLHANGNLCDALKSDPKLAMAACGRAAELFPDSAPIRQNLIGALVALNRLDDAQHQVDEGIRRNGEQLAAVAGDVARARRDLPRAVLMYRRALARQPWDLASTANLAGSLVDLGRLDDARQVVGQLDARALSSDWATQHALAELHLVVGWRERACAELEQLRARTRSERDGLPVPGPLESACGR